MSTDTPRSGGTAPTVYLHIGAMKAGTTFLQQALTHHADTLRGRGVLFPNNPGYRQQVAAARDVLRLPGPVSARERTGAWQRLTREIKGWSGSSVIISVEHLSVAKRDQIATIVESLAPAQVQVVITVRDLARVMPSTWQENIQNGLSWTWTEFCDSVMEVPDAPPQAGRRFWHQHDMAPMVRRWSSTLGVDAITVLTVPKSGADPSLLWERFCTAVGLEANEYPLDDANIGSNASLGRGSVEFLRRLNIVLADRLDKPSYAKNVKRAVAKNSLASLPSSGSAVALDATQLAWVADRAAKAVSALERSGVLVIGDLQELLPVASGTTASGSAASAPVPPEEIVAAATAAAASLVHQLIDGETQRPARVAAPGGRRPGARP